MMKFASFETIVELIYKHVIPAPKEQCSKPLQLGVSFAGGYIAGVFSAVVSHPADNLVSFLNNAKGATVGDVSFILLSVVSSILVSNVCLYAALICSLCMLFLHGHAIKKLGLWGLFTRGLPLRIVMIGALTGAQWGIYDAF